VLVSPPVGKAIPKGRFTSGFVARLLCEKFVLGRPAHRIVAALAHDGLHVAEGTLAGVFTACSGLLGPLAQAITGRNAAAGHLHVDETSWNVFAAVDGVLAAVVERAGGGELRGHLRAAAAGSQLAIKPLTWVRRPS
jgi:hypothetical protein